jgi:EAL domain-containing protein (putative c-di-GMP-specific phosphodiesterase class I)/GGDEF domain-containing protein
MTTAVRDVVRRWQHFLRTSLQRVEVIALFPLSILGAHAAGEPRLVLVAGLLLPTLLVLQMSREPVLQRPAHLKSMPQRDLPPANRQAMLDMMRRISAMDGYETACFVLEIDDWDKIEHQLGCEAGQDIRDTCRRRLWSALCGDDLVADLGAGGFGVVLHPVDTARLTTRDAVADRLRIGLSAPFVQGETRFRLSACIGHAALPGAQEMAAERALAAATKALRDAQVAGPGSVRSYVEGSREPKRNSVELSDDVQAALEGGDIRAWFQPQIDARTGTVAGFEALARWKHPELGLLAPVRFLGAIEVAGRMDAFATEIRRDAIDALRTLGQAGHASITVSVNACTLDLRNPSYAEEIAWDLDAAGIAPERLIVEVLESVAGDARDDAVMATLAALRSQGIGIDLDDFGVGQASLLSIRRFGIRRIKIDRTFVIGIDHDLEQQALVSGVVSLGRELGLETLAEGVETPEEQETLTRLGCAYLQGFGIAPPMRLSDAVGWLGTRPDVPSCDHGAHSGSEAAVGPAE